jgi:hypothetical protein
LLYYRNSKAAARLAPVATFEVASNLFGIVGNTKVEALRGTGTRFTQVTTSRLAFLAHAYKY